VGDELMVCDGLSVTSCDRVDVPDGLWNSVEDETCDCEDVSVCDGLDVAACDIVDICVGDTLCDWLKSCDGVGVCVCVGETMTDRSGESDWLGEPDEVAVSEGELVSVRLLEEVAVMLRVWVSDAVSV
jgi:hypothetical protein